MTSGHWKEVEDAFLSALDLTEPSRGAYLSALAPAVRREVEGLLKGHTKADAMLPATKPEPAAGALVGPYRLLEPLGRGGMGIVFRAERCDEQFRQQVAIKILTRQITGYESLARFRMERQILAVLDHPNIVRLLDGGVTSEGAPYYAMELVDGQPITLYAIEKNLDLASRLALFEQVCGAIEYAHQRQVVHRDLKPANILVNHSGAAKVLDFGIAKLLAPLEGVGASVITQFAPLTPAYASPEHLRGETVTTASDIYSLGLVLYELLTDQRAQPSVRPSQAARGRGIARDLDSIVLKALSEKPEERYGSAADLGRDLRRFRDGLPVSAQQATLRYVLGKGLARHRKPVAVGAAAVVLAGGALGWQARQAAIERERRYEQVRDVTRNMLGDMQARIRDLPGSLEARKNLTAQALGYLEALRKDAGGDPRLATDLAQAYVQMANLQGGPSVTNLGDIPGAQRSLDNARELCEQVLRREPGREETQTVLADYYSKSAEIAYYTKRGEDARAADQKALDLRRALAAAQPNDLQRQAALAGAVLSLGIHHVELAKRQPLIQESLAISEAALARDSTNQGTLRNAALAAKYLGAAYTTEKRFDDARRLTERALQWDRQLLALDPKNRQRRLDVTFDLSTLGTLADKQSQFAEAERLFAEVVRLRAELVAEEPKDIRARDRLAYAQMLHGAALVKQKRFAEAVPVLQASLQISEGIMRDAPAMRKITLSGWLLSQGFLADAWRHTGHQAAACQGYAQAVAALGEIGAALENDSETERHVRAQHAECHGKVPSKRAP
jgi:tetratricopeptide (TPR) repeat protein